MKYNLKSLNLIKMKAYCVILNIIVDKVPVFLNLVWVLPVVQKKTILARLIRTIKDKTISEQLKINQNAA